MKYATLRVWAFVAFAGSFCVAQAQMNVRWNFGTPPPLHPTIIQGKYKGKTLPILAVSGEGPEVEVDGKLKRLRLYDAHYTPTRGATYAPGSIVLRNMKGNSSKTKLRLMFAEGGEVDGGTISARSDFSATVDSTEDYKDCFVALIFFDADYLDGKTDNPSATVQFKSLKPLHKGENKIELTFGYLDFGKRRTGFFPLFFTKGLEIRSNECEKIAKFFRHREDSLHQLLLSGYLKKHGSETKPCTPYLQIPPVFPDGMREDALPARVNVSFMVNEEGRVESLQLPTKLPANIYRLLTRAVNGWLFMPRLKDGRPERTMVSLPLILRPDEVAQTATHAAN
ncbi:MAG TPA: hypothetical protein VFT72_13985 [Opitutaceae bacterium]|nr:hypothetical protein [Opitutaceae bacterium]